MGTDDTSLPDSRRDDCSRALARIAELLECSPEVFTDGAGAPADIRQMRELVDLWSMIDTDDKRARALNVMRRLARA